MESSSPKNTFAILNTPNPDNNKANKVEKIIQPMHSQSIITLNKEEYYLNENIIGFIKLIYHEDKPITSIHIKLFQIHFWSSIGHKIKHKQTHTLHTQNIEIVSFVPSSSTFKSHNNNLFISRGEYIFPFNINIPPQTLPSFEFSNSIHNIKIYIRTYLTIDSQIDNDCHNIIPLTIHSMKPSIINKTPSTVSENTNIFKLGLFKKGGVNITINSDDNKYLNGSKALLSVNIDNNSDSTMKEINVELYRKIVLKEDEKEYDFIMKVNSIKRDVVCKAKDKMVVDDIILIIDDDCYINDNYECIILDRGDINVNFIMPSIKTTGFECTYYITVSAIADALVKGNKPHCTLPIIVIY